MEYEVYRHKDATDEDFDLIDTMFKRILAEDKYLCNNTQRNLEAGIYLSGELHTRMEKGPLFIQETVRKLVRQHHELEKKLQREIWPAQQVLSDSVVEQDELLCSSLTCRNDKLDW